MSKLWVVTQVCTEERIHHRIVETDTKEEAEQIMYDAESLENSTYDYDDPDEVQGTDCECSAREAEADDDEAYEYLVVEDDSPCSPKVNWIPEGF